MNKTLRTLALALGGAVPAVWSGSAHAAYTFYNDDGANGTLSGGYPVFTITGSDDGSGNDDTAFYVQTYASATRVSFTWQYASFDAGGSAYDPAGWILDGVETQLSVDGGPGSTSRGALTVDIGAGQTFGWYVHSFDSTSGAGVLAVDVPPPVPEPRGAAMLLAALAAWIVATRRRRDA
jgi:hypothetical protein